MKMHNYLEKLYTGTFDLITQKRPQLNQMISAQGLVLSDYIKKIVVPHEQKYSYSLYLSYKKYCIKKRFYLSKKYTSKLENVLSYLTDEESKRIFDWLVCFKTVSCLFNKSIAEKFFPYPCESILYLMRLEARKLKKIDGLYCIDDYAMEITDKGLIPEIWLADTYLLKNICEPELNDVVIDGGAFQGETAIWFGKKVGIGGKVYSFEIIESNIHIIKRNIQRNKLQNVIEVTEKGLFNKDDVINVVDNGAGSRYSKGKGDNKANVTSLDKFITLNNINKVDFIKLDIEGSEMLALKGMKDTIKKFKPKLAICIYHKQLDFLDIPIYIKSIMPEYKIYFSHKIPSVESTILFAII